MKTLTKVALPLIGILLLLWVAVAAQAGHIPTVGLGTAQTFAVLAGQGITNTGGTTVRGDIGSHPNTSVGGFPPGTVTDGTINPSYTADAKDALVTAYDDAAGRTPVTTIATELGGETLLHGVYDSSSGTFEISVGQTLTLDAQNDADAVWIFKMESTLITGSNSNVNIINSPDPAAATCRIFWQIGSSATLGTGSTMRGTLMALTSISLNNSATLLGRALARNGSVTMDTNTIDASACFPAQASPSPSPSPTTDTSPSPASEGSPGSGSSGPDSPDGTNGLPETGLTVAAGVTSALLLVLIGLLYNWLGVSSTRFARTLRGYQPKHQAGRRR